MIATEDLWYISDSVEQDIKNWQSTADTYFELVKPLLEDRDKVIELQKVVLTSNAEIVRLGSIPAKWEIPIYLADFTYLALVFDYDVLEGANSAVYPWLGRDPVVALDTNMNAVSYPFLALHELIEMHVINEEGWPYKRAHTLASFFEYTREKEYLISIGKLPRDFQGTLEGQKKKSLIGDK